MDSSNFGEWIGRGIRTAILVFSRFPLVFVFIWFGSHHFLGNFKCVNTLLLWLFMIQRLALRTPSKFSLVFFFFLGGNHSDHVFRRSWLFYCNDLDLIGWEYQQYKIGKYLNECKDTMRWAPIKYDLCAKIPNTEKRKNELNWNVETIELLTDLNQ